LGNGGALQFWCGGGVGGGGGGGGGGVGTAIAESVSTLRVNYLGWGPVDEKKIKIKGEDLEGKNQLRDGGQSKSK